MKKDIVIAVVAVVVVVVVTLALAGIRPNLPTTPADTKAAAKEASGRVVMRINGEPVTETEFAQFINEAPPEQRSMYATPQGRRLLADELVKIKALEQEGRKLGVDKDPETLAQINVVAAQVRAGKALQKLVGTPNEAALRAEYEKEKASYETVQLSHILVGYQGGQVPPRKGQALPASAAMQKAQGLEQRLRGGADFAALARSESDDVASSNQGGLLGEVPISQLPADLRPAVAALQPGQISPAVRSTYGIHIFKAGERHAQPFERVKPMLEDNFKRTRLEETMKRLTDNAKVDLDPNYFPAQKATPDLQPAAKP